MGHLYKQTKRKFKNLWSEMKDVKNVLSVYHSKHTRKNIRLNTDVYFITCLIYSKVQ
jgi:hypothetical protein